MLSMVQSDIDHLDTIEPGPQTIEAREAVLKKVLRAIFTTGEKIENETVS